MSITFFRAWIPASYLAVLLVQLNYKWHATKVFTPLGSVRIQPTLAPSLDLEPSKCKVKSVPISSSFSFDVVMWKPTSIGSLVIHWCGSL